MCFCKYPSVCYCTHQLSLCLSGCLSRKCPSNQFQIVHNLQFALAASNRSKMTSPASSEAAGGFVMKWTKVSSISMPFVKWYSGQLIRSLVAKYESWGEKVLNWNLISAHQCDDVQPPVSFPHPETHRFGGKVVSQLLHNIIQMCWH